MEIVYLKWSTSFFSRTSIDLQFQIWKHGKIYAYLEKEKKVGWAIIERIHVLSLSDLLGFVVFIGYQNCLFWSPSAIQLEFLFINFLYFPFLIKTFMRKHHWSRFKFFQQFFCPSVSGRHFPVCCVSHWRENAQTGNLLRSHSSNKAG